MGKFIDEVAKINQNNNHKYKITEEKNNVKNALFKRILEEFRNTDEDFEDTYSKLSKIDTMRKICCHDFDFGYHVTLEFIYTTYQKELEKVYKMFKKEEKSVLAREKLCEEMQKQQEEERVAPKHLYLVLDNRGKMKELETYVQHAKNNIPLMQEYKGDYRIDHFNVFDRNKKPYDFKIYYFKDGENIDVKATTTELKIDGLLDGVKIKEKLIPLIFSSLFTIALLSVFIGCGAIGVLAIILLILFTCIKV